MKSGKVNALVGAAAAAGTNILTHMCVCIENRVDRLPELAAELARRQVAVIVTTGGTPPALAAMAATKTIPIVFLVGQDPVRLALVTSLARPGGNLTSINLFANELEAKRMELLRELVPRAARR
jgi:ABC-type uncharacterized transport system substrate-binding protein